MKKAIAMMMSVLMLLSVSIFAFADGDELVPGTAFPMPDSLTSVKSVSTDRMQEEIMLQLMGVDVIIDVVYADEAAASQALGEYRSKLELLFPGLTDDKGNILKLPDSTSAKDFPVSVILNKEPVSVVGMENIGWFDISSCNDTLTEVQYSRMEGTMAVSTKDNLAIIQCGPSDLGDSNEDFSVICERFLRKFTTYNNGELIPESENAYKNVESAELELDGAPAYKVSYETEDLWGRCEMLSTVSYVTTNPAGEYVRINIYAPKEGHLDKDGNPFRPGIEDLISIIETTYTRTEP